ncbi:MAG: PLP-dependent aminotransferase family protein [Chloroflexi bacterium]|nr:PLP-dependent aminotransferase family protein [Chloroflexota bacterium]
MAAAFDWSSLYARRVERFRGSAIREMFHWAQLPGMISLSAGSPAPELFPVEEFKAACVKVLDEDAGPALQYGITEGYPPLREWIAEHMRSKGVHATADEVLVTTGSLQAMDLLSRVMLDPGDPVVVEAPTFIGTLQCVDASEARYVSIPMDDDGLLVDALERELGALDRPPKLLAVQPNFQNPTGVTLSLERRRRLVRLAMDRGIPFVEDDPYSELIYEGDPLPAIKSFDEADMSVYLGSFSKILMPGIRVGWAVGPKAVLEKMGLIKQGSDLHTDGFIQRVIVTMLRSGFLPAHIERLRADYKSRRDVMLEAIAEHFPPSVRCAHPRGGLFVWVELPAGSDCSLFMREAVDKLVLFPAGAGFYRNGQGQNTMRLNFSNQPPDRLREGIKRLGQVIRKHVPLG